jgi:FkbM family methyltransferase
MPVGDLVYDVGMHAGEDSAYYLAKGYRVVAFEANPDLIAACKARFADAIAVGRLIIVEGAITEAGTGTVRFYRHGAHTAWGTIEADWVQRNEAVAPSDAIEVPAIDFVACLRKYGVPHYLKVDIEGADRVCIEALRKFEDRPAYVSQEAEKVDFEMLRTDLNVLSDLGYDKFAIVQQGGMERRAISTTTLDGSRLTYNFEPEASGCFGADIPSRWLDRAAAIRRYQLIFGLYRLLGDDSFVERNRFANAVRWRLQRLTRWPLPGWYDTHARHIKTRSV